MRNRDAIAKSGRTEPFALGHAGNDRSGIGTEALTRDLSELLDQATLVRRDEAGPDRFEIKELGKLHVNAL